MQDYEFLFDKTADSMCEIDAGGRFVRLNAACEELLGPSEIKNNICDTFDARGRQELQEILAAISANHATARFEGFHVSSQRWTLWQLTRLSDDRIVAVGRDVTDHHETARTLHEKQEFLHSIIEAEPECVKLVSDSGELLDMNRAGLAMIGAQTREEAIGANVYDIVAPEDRERFVQFNEAVCKGTSGELSFDIISFDGTRRSMETVAVPLASPERTNDDGGLIHLAITRDVTHRHLLESHLRQSQKIEAIGHMAGGIAHDFNNLLTAIIGPAEVALAKLGEQHPASGDLAQIKGAGERAARLTHQLLGFARQQVPTLEVLSLGDLVTSLREMLERLLGETIELIVDVEPESWPVKADRVHLEQVLLNLVVNARDAVENNGRIQITVGNVELTESQGNRLGCAAGPNVLLSVTDNGTGISEQTLPSIFDPFFTTKSQGRGTGLGLSTCYGIVKQINGAIDIDSTVNEGTKITVYLPGLPGHDVQSEVQSQDKHHGNAHVLVVEDEAIVRRTIVTMLEAAGYSVSEAENGQHAMERLHELMKVDLVVSDISMPVMDGRELARRLRSEQPQIRTLLVTGYLTSTTDEDAGSATRVLNKPFTTEQLRSAVAEALNADLPS